MTSKKRILKEMKELCINRFERFGTAGNGSKIQVISLDTMAEEYLSGLLDPKISQ